LGAPIINAAEFAAFVLVFLRTSTLVVFAPIMGATNVPTQVKAILCLMLTFAIAPRVAYPAEMMPMTWYGFVFLGLGEFMISFTLAFMVRLVLEAAHIAGEYVSFQMGLSMLNAMDPQSGGQMPTLALLIHMMMSLVFLYANGHMLVIKALTQSFQVAPPGLLNIWRPEVFTEIIKAMAGMYVLALKIAAPMVAVLFCIKVAFGITAKAVPQMNIMFVGIPVYIIVGFLVIGFALPWWPQLLGRALISVDLSLGRVLGFLAPAAQ
jgi:flagellar biosynthetic protein FliR